MSKPWARIEQNFINHQKFLALTANAICFWLEGKNYCDMYQTDGLIPRTALSTFRWRSSKCVELLLRSCGHKPNGDPYAPLWDAVDIGGVSYYRMHDYLEHNDCRDEVLQRIEDADDKTELRRLKAKGRMRDVRAERKRELETLRAAANVREPSANTTAHVREQSANGSRTVRPQTETPTETETPTATDPPQKQEEERPHSARSKRPIFSGERLTVFEWMLDELCRLLGPHTETFHLDEWFYALDAQCLLNHVIPPDRDNGAWLKKQCLTEAQRRGLPLKVGSADDEDDVWAELARKGPSVRP